MSFSLMPITVCLRVVRIGVARRWLLGATLLSRSSGVFRVDGRSEWYSALSTSLSLTRDPRVDLRDIFSGTALSLSDTLEPRVARCELTGLFAFSFTLPISDTLLTSCTLLSDSLSPPALSLSDTLDPRVERLLATIDAFSTTSVSLSETLLLVRRVARELVSRGVSVD